MLPLWSGGPGCALPVFLWNSSARGCLTLPQSLEMHSCHRPSISWPTHHLPTSFRARSNTGHRGASPRIGLWSACIGNLSITKRRRTAPARTAAMMLYRAIAEASGCTGPARAIDQTKTSFHARRMAQVSPLPTPLCPTRNFNLQQPFPCGRKQRDKEATVPIILWLLGVPLSLIVLLMLFGFFR